VEGINMKIFNFIKQGICKIRKVTFPDIFLISNLFPYLNAGPAQAPHTTLITMQNNSSKPIL